jgi:hypothetical protein
VQRRLEMYGLPADASEETRRQGWDLVSCWRTPGGLGEDVTVTHTFRMDDWAHWEELRGRSVLDAANAAWVDRRAGFMRRGTRRFYEPAAWSPR